MNELWRNCGVVLTLLSALSCKKLITDNSLSVIVAVIIIIIEILHMSYIDRLKSIFIHANAVVPLREVLQTKLQPLSNLLG